MNNTILDSLPFFYGYPLLALRNRIDCQHVNCMCIDNITFAKFNRYMDDLTVFLTNFVSYYRKNDCVKELKLNYNVQGTYEFFERNNNKYIYLLKYLHYRLVIEKEMRNNQSKYIDDDINLFILSLKTKFSFSFVVQNYSIDETLPFKMLYDDNNQLVESFYCEWDYNKIKQNDLRIKKSCKCVNYIICPNCELASIHESCECKTCVDGLDSLTIEQLNKEELRNIFVIYNRVSQNWAKFL